MKQHIEIEQWNELGAAGKQKVREWSKTHPNGRLPHLMYGKKLHDDSDSFTIHSSTRREDLAPSYAVLLTIGQMIEFLDEYSFWDNHGISRPKMGNEKGWSLFEMKNDVDILTYGNKELRNALWEAVKEVLRG